MTPKTVSIPPRTAAQADCSGKAIPPGTIYSEHLDSTLAVSLQDCP